MSLLQVILLGLGILLIYAAVVKDPIGGSRNPANIVKAVLTGNAE